MDNHSCQRQNRLLAIAQQDMIYNTWEKSFEDCRKAFAHFASNQSEEIRNMLYGYADCGRMAQQRLVNLACRTMLFPDEQVSYSVCKEDT